MISSGSKKRLRNQTLEELFRKRKHGMVEEVSEANNSVNMVVVSSDNSDNIGLESSTIVNSDLVEEPFQADSSENMVEVSLHNSGNVVAESSEFPNSLVEEMHASVVDSSNVVFSEARRPECLQSNEKFSDTIVDIDNDIGNYIGKKIDDFTKCKLLEEPWKAPDDFQFPFSEHNKCGKTVKRTVNLQHFEKYKWLVFSVKKQGLFCKYCPWFTNPSGEGRHNATSLMKLVTSPLTHFAKLTGEKGHLETHSKRAYHKNALEAGKEFLASYHNPARDVMSQVNQKHLSEVLENRDRLKPILESIIFLGRQNIPLRGHRDDGNLNFIEEGSKAESTINQGNFKELLLFRIASGDKTLKNHLKNTSSRATYISKTVQNELISCCGQEITELVVNRVKSSNLYTILFDETTDLSHKSQISLILRYTHNSQEIREDFVGFIDAFQDVVSATADEIEYNISDEEDAQLTRASLVDEGKEYSLTGKALGQIVLRKLKKLSLPLDRCVGIGTDGCSVMLSERKGAVTEVQKECFNALKCSCKNHILNLSLSKSSQVVPVRNSVGVMKEVISFFSASPKRNKVILRHLKHQLTKLCETRWVDRHDGTIQFFTDLPKILDSLEEISAWQDSSTASKAKSLAISLCDSEFLVAMNCLSDVLALSLPLSKQLQKVNLDLKNAADLVADTISILQERRLNANDYFQHGIWIRVNALATNLGIEIKKPRLCSRQTQRTNYQTETTEDYYRLSIFIPLLDNVLVDLNSRFDSSTFDAFHLPLILPNCALESDAKNEDETDSIKKLINLFHPLLHVNESTGIILLQNEYLLWKKKWTRHQSPVPSTAIEALSTCDKDVYPLISQLLQILATLPISNATAERTFSTLRRLKTWLRSVMGQDRLTGLALLNVHRDIRVEVERIITHFAKSGNRRLNFAV